MKNDDFPLKLIDFGTYYQLSKPPHDGDALQWHQDAPLWPILDPEQSHCMVSAWVTFDSVDESNGALQMVPGSYMWGDCMDEINEIRRIRSSATAARELGLLQLPGGRAVARTCPVSKGEVHFHHALTWHGSGRNASDRPRRAHALHFMRPDTRYVAAKDHVMKQCVECADGEAMSGAGPHFPRVSDSSGRVLEHKTKSTGH